MGFFSSNCHSCGHPLLCPQATETINGWMSKGVAITSDGDIATGTYDGYGRLNEAEVVGIVPSTVWHRACWEKAGKPMDYLGASESAADQGWFFNDGAHDMAEPK